MTRKNEQQNKPEGRSRRIDVTQYFLWGKCFWRSKKDKKQSALTLAALACLTTYSLSMKMSTDINQDSKGERRECMGKVDNFNQAGIVCPNPRLQSLALLIRELPSTDVTL